MTKTSSEPTSLSRSFKALAGIALLAGFLAPGAANFLDSAKTAPSLPEVALMPSPIVNASVLVP